MQINDFVKQLDTVYDRKRVLESIENIKRELTEQTMPAYADSVEFFSKYTLVSKEAKEFEKLFPQIVKTTKERKLVKGVYECLKNVKESLDGMEWLASTFLENVVATDHITYLQANLIRTIDCAAFVTTYARKLLNFVIAKETDKQTNDKYVGGKLLKVEEDYINNGYNSFLFALDVCSEPKDKLKKRIEESPEMIVDDNNYEDVVASAGITKVTNVSMNFIPGILSPIWLIRSMWADWQVRSYHAAKEDLKVIEMRKSYLQDVSNGKRDPAIEQEIEYLTKLAQERAYEIKQLEDKYLKGR